MEQERECKNHGLTKFVFRSDNRWRCRKCAVDAVVRARQRLKAKAVAYKGGKCQSCGYHRCVAGLAFHHRDPFLKEFAITDLFNSGRRWSFIVTELDKCDLLCNNCHAEIEIGFVP